MKEKKQVRIMLQNHCLPFQFFPFPIKNIDTWYMLIKMQISEYMVLQK